MSSKTLEGMARAYHEASDAHHSEKILAAAAALLGDNVKDEMDKMRRALLWLADNIPNEMLHAAKAEADVQDADDWRMHNERARFFGFASRDLPASMTS